MLYQKNHSASLDGRLFQNPSAEYRGAPFWAWNCRVTREDVDRILADLKSMGMGGAHIHSRTGMDLPYLSEEFMEMVRYAHGKAKELGMLTWLYDEDRFPSGAAGGLVTKRMEYRQRVLVLAPESLCESRDVFGNPLKENQRRYLGKYALWLKEGCLEKYRFLGTSGEEPEDAGIWYLYREAMGDNPWFNNQAYADTLNGNVTEEFIRLTHESYYRELGEDFGKSVPAVFTDEPQFWHKETLGYAEEKKRLLLPFTDDFPDTYRQKYGCDFFESLPECIWELPEGRLSAKRYRYHEHISQRFAEAFADRLGSWCRKHGIALTGHMMEEPTLASQTAMIGEAMRSYRGFELPGIDMLYDGRELNTAKQAQSAARQYGREGMLSELYGVTNWDFDFRGHKLAGDWQAALGVTVRVHHLTWTSMAGEAKRDYPASIGSQSPWYREYSFLEDYFARLNTALTRGRCQVKIGVVHPIESFWLYYGTEEQTGEVRREREEHFRLLTEWLLYGLLDFDFIAESLWQELTPDGPAGGRGEEKAGHSCEAYLPVGDMKYDVVIVPDLVTIRKSSLERLKAFRERGGRVLFVGQIPAYVDALRSSEAEEFARSCQSIPFSRSRLLETLEEFRTLDIHNGQGGRTDNLIYQMRQDTCGKWLFLAHCRRMHNPDLPKREDLTIELRGTYRPVLYDAMTGEIKRESYICRNGKTLINRSVYDHDSLLYFLEERHCGYEEKERDREETNQITERGDVQGANNKKAELQNDAERPAEEVLRLEDTFEYCLEEPNVLVLDMAEYRLDEEQWQEKEEILRIDNRLRKKLGYPLRTEAFAQPWADRQQDDGKRHTLTLKFVIYAQTEIPCCRLALENAGLQKLVLNGRTVESLSDGYFTDPSIETVELPGLLQGENRLIVTVPYSHGFALEAMYLLGDFGVAAAGKNCIVTKKRSRLAFGDICSQGLPFYGGNLICRLPVTTDRKGTIRVEITRFRCSLIGVRLDGRDCGRIAFSPYVLETGETEAGEHLLELTVYGNRVNTFGALHNCNCTEPWPGHPDSYRTEGSAWAYEYQLKQTGILISPVITLKSTEA